MWAYFVVSIRTVLCAFILCICCSQGAQRYFRVVLAAGSKISWVWAQRGRAVLAFLYWVDFSIRRQWKWHVRWMLVCMFLGCHCLWCIMLSYYFSYRCFLSCLFVIFNIRYALNKSFVVVTKYITVLPHRIYGCDGSPPCTRVSVPAGSSSQQKDSSFLLPLSTFAGEANQVRKSTPGVK